MAVKKGLSLDGVFFLADVINNPTQKPDWMKWGSVLGQLTGNYSILNFITGFKGLDRFVFKGKNWTIGGVAFDGIMRTDHSSHIRATQYPVQTGVTMTDHAIIEPAELTIDIMMTDTANNNLYGSVMNNLSSFLIQGAENIIGKTAGMAVSIAVTADKIVSSGILGEFGENLKKKNPGLFGWLKAEVDGPSDLFMVGEGRSVSAWKKLKQMQLDRQPLTVETRLQTYENMLIEDLSAPDDYQTLNCLKCSVHLRQILFANAAEVAVSARKATTTQAAEGGQQAVKSLDNNRTALKAGTGILSHWVGKG